MRSPNELSGRLVRAPHTLRSCSHVLILCVEKTRNFREVPDNQEVYVSMTDGNDISVIFDIAQRVEAPSGPSDMDAVDYHFEDVAVDQDRTAKIWNKRAISVPHQYVVSSA